MVTGDGDIAGIRIIPPIVEFVDASQNEVYSAKFTVQNVSKFGKRLRFHPPVTEVRFCTFHEVYVKLKPISRSFKFLSYYFQMVFVAHESLVYC